MKKRILAIIGLIAYIALFVWLTLRGIPTKEEMAEIMAEKNSEVAVENTVTE